MGRKEIGTIGAVLLLGAALAGGNAYGQEVSGYLMGDPAPGKLVPYFTIADNRATIVGIENVYGKDGPTRDGNDSSIVDSTTDKLVPRDVEVHVVIFDEKSNEVTNFPLCLSPYDFGFFVLQQSAPDADQQTQLSARNEKVRYLSVEKDFLPTKGYATIKARDIFTSTDGSCQGTPADPLPVMFQNGDSAPLATWAILADVGSGFFATEIPTPTANIDYFDGKVSGGPGAFGLIPGPQGIKTTTECDNSKGNRVLARFDVNPDIGSQTQIFVWLQGNSGTDIGGTYKTPGTIGNADECKDSENLERSGTVTAYLDCEDETEQSTTVSLPNEVNVIDPSLLAGISQCEFKKPRGLPEYRGVLSFEMPDTGFIWSHISQVGANYRENFLGYNLDCNSFIVEHVTEKDEMACRDAQHVLIP